MRIALVAATVDEARAVMVEGPSGLLACARGEEIAEWSPARRELVFAGGARATLFSGANPEALRGPQHHFAWCDELAKWRHPQRSWDMLQLGLLRRAAAGAGHHHAARRLRGPEAHSRRAGHGADRRTDGRQPAFALGVHGRDRQRLRRHAAGAAGDRRGAAG
jgi:hypothetical protein